MKKEMQKLVRIATVAERSEKLLKWHEKGRFTVPQIIKALKEHGTGRNAFRISRVITILINFFGRRKLSFSYIKPADFASANLRFLSFSIAHFPGQDLAGS